MTFPKTTCPTSSGLTCARHSASRTTVAPSTVGGKSLRLPPYLPTAVRTPLSTTTSQCPSIITSVLRSRLFGPGFTSTQPDRHHLRIRSRALRATYCLQVLVVLREQRP